MIVTATVLNVRSGPGTDFRELGQLTQAVAVTVQETHGDWVYVSPPGGWVNRSYLAPDRALQPPAGLPAILAMFGQPGAPECSAGRVKLPAPVKLGWQNASVSVVACHSKLEETFSEVFRAVHREGLWARVRTFDGIYNKRPTKAGGKMSTHSWGIAVDLNAATNQQGTVGDMSPELVSVFEQQGFQWGGRWRGKTRDDMHMQFAEQY